MASIAIRLGTLITFLLSKTLVLLWVIRSFNRDGKIINSIFLCYAGDRKYANHYSFAFVRNWIRWSPTPIGFLKQGDAWGIVVATPVTEKELVDPANREQLRKLIQRVNKLASRIGAKQKNYAGILPSLFDRHFPDEYPNNAVVVARIVSESLDRVSGLHMPSDSSQPQPVVLLGGNGHIGVKLQSLLRGKHYSVYVVDPNGGHNCIPENLTGKPIILVDVSRRGAINQYIEQLWPEVVLLNETFPEPSASTLRELGRKKVHVLHIAGVPGSVYPSLPFGYKGCVPCCAVHDVSKIEEAVIVSLSNHKPISSEAR